jgi:hypothetical protein
VALSLKEKVVPPVYSKFRVHAVVTYYDLAAFPSHNSEISRLNPIAQHNPKIIREALGFEPEINMNRIGNGIC